MAVEYTTLILIFRSKLALALSETESTKVLRLGSQVFTDSIDLYPIGFYDWLRNGRKELVGIDFSIQKVPYLDDELGRFPYVRTRNYPYLQVFFSNSESYDEKYSGIQDFIEYRILKSANGEYAIAFSTHFLDDSDLKRLRTFGLDWETQIWESE